MSCSKEDSHWLHLQDMYIDDYLLDVFSSHGVQLQPHGGWLTANRSYPSCRSYVHALQQHDGYYSVRVDINVALNDSRVIIESFGDSGATIPEALMNACHNFTTSVLHVFLSAIWNHHDDEQVLRETWSINKADWIIFLGNIVRKSTGGIEVPIPDDLITAIETLIRSAAISPEPHWLRVYFANLKSDDQIIEVLFDNEIWNEGEQCIRNVKWPVKDTFYSARMFLMMVPADGNGSRTVSGRVG
jgi:hypothetical protein